MHETLAHKGEPRDELEEVSAQSRDGEGRDASLVVDRELVTRLPRVSLPRPTP